MMTKIILTISLVTNLTLAYFLVNKKEEPKLERIVIETPAEKPVSVENSVTTTASAPKVMPEAKEDKKPSLVSASYHDVPAESEIREASEKMETDRQEFMMNELGMTEDKIAQHNKIREQFFKKTSSFWEKNPMRELTFKERRKLIEFEEEFHNNLIKLHGEKNWAKYQKYREKYNEKSFKSQMEDNRPTVFMGL